MWVRSQNKEVLADIKEITLEEGKCDCCVLGVSYSRIDEDKLLLLGVYSTEEKVMKILDELQFRIARSESGVYQMPKGD